MSYFGIDGFYNIGNYFETFENKSKDSKKNETSSKASSKVSSVSKTSPKLSPKLSNRSSRFDKSGKGGKKEISFKPAIRQFSKDIMGALKKLQIPKFNEYQLSNMSDIDKTTAEIRQNKLIRFYDNNDKETSIKLMKNNDVCVTRNQKTICLPDKDFVFKPNTT